MMVLRVIGPVLLALAAALAIDRLTARRGLRPPGFDPAWRGHGAALVRRGLAMAVVAGGALDRRLRPAGHLGRRCRAGLLADPPHAAVPAARPACRRSRRLVRARLRRQRRQLDGAARLQVRAAVAGAGNRPGGRRRRLADRAGGDGGPGLGDLGARRPGSAARAAAGADPVAGRPADLDAAGGQRLRRRVRRGVLSRLSPASRRDPGIDRAVRAGPCRLRAAADARRRHAAVAAVRPAGSLAPERLGGGRRARRLRRRAAADRRADGARAGARGGWRTAAGLWRRWPSGKLDAIRAR